MNFLAHLALSAPDEEEMIGNLMGDFTRWVDVETLPAAMRRGIALHRAIDRFTDFHPIFSTSKERISDERWRFSGVLVDVFYDHFLARDFSRHMGRELRGFLDEVYAALRRRQSGMPERVVPVLDRMIEQDWMGSYVTLEGIGGILERMSRRLKRETNLGSGVVELEAAYEGLEGDFERFWPEVRRLVEGERGKIGLAGLA
jgi:acyl carrier protein phosphodiesterase